MPVQTNDVFEITFEGDLSGQVELNVLHYQVSIVGSTTDPALFSQEIIDAIDAPSDLLTKFRAACPVEYTMFGIKAQKVSPVREVFQSDDVAHAGTGATMMKTPNVCAVVTKRTATMGHRKQGTLTSKGSTGDLHIPGIPDTAALNGLITDAYAVTLEDLGTELLLPLTLASGGEVVPCLWHRLAGSQPQASQLISFVVQREVRVMRRRTVGHGI
jgi:hypothetical protein